MATHKMTITPLLESNFKFQVSTLDSNKNTTHTEHKRATVTISREFGCEGYPLAHRIAEKLSTSDDVWHIFNRDIFNQITESTHYSERLLEQINTPERRTQLQQYLDHFFTHAPTELTRFKQLAQNIKAVAHKGRAIIVGSDGAILGHGDTLQFHVRLVASMDFKVKRLKPLVPDLSPAEIIETIEHTNNNRAMFVREFTAKDITDPSH